MTGSVLVTGASGTLGRAVTRYLLDDGRQVRGLSRHPLQEGAVAWVAGDLLTGAGMEQALAGVDAIVHCATDLRHPRVDSEGTQKLIDAAQRAGAPHLVYISIVGADRIPLGYYRAKVEAESKVRAGGLPWTILRATQFHQLLISALEVLARLPVLMVPAETRFQPVDPEEVAQELARLASGDARELVPDFGGPELRSSLELARTYLVAKGKQRPVLAVKLPGKIAGGYRQGGHLTPNRAVGRRTWEQFLADHSTSATDR